MNRALKHWTGAEIETLWRHAICLPTDVLARAMGRSPRAIKQKCSEMRIPCKQHKTGRKRLELFP
jgi:hypothetical protein